MTLPILVLPFLLAAFVGTQVAVHQQEQTPAPKSLPVAARADIAWLKQVGFDLSKRHERLYNGRSVIVMGALEGDSTSAQVWLDKERFAVVRIIGPRAEQRIQR